MKKKDNRGMSLVEIILVIALMIVVAGVTGYGVSMIGQKPVEECARKVEIALNQNRTNSMGKQDAYLEFYMTDDDRVAFQECWKSVRDSDDSVVHRGTEAVIGATDVKLRFVYKDAAGDETVVNMGTDHIKVSFKRDSGSLVEEGGLVLDRIEIYKGEGHVKKVSIDKLTGKVTLQ
ncbi:MAG: type II secretion system GspH family protein [Acetatifactor sp.]|nr:type II secretion system GspH family protein [Acetatifactor sp.]